MRRLPIAALLLLLTGAMPLMAQESSGDAGGAGKTADGGEDAGDDAKDELSEEAKNLLDDVDAIYRKYYEIVLDKIKTNAAYKADDVWDEAVKSAVHSEFKTSKEFFEAVQKLQKKDRKFRKKSTDLQNELAKEHREAVRKWAEESSGG